MRQMLMCNKAKDGSHRALPIDSRSTVLERARRLGVPLIPIRYERGLATSPGVCDA